MALGRQYHSSPHFQSAFFRSLSCQLPRMYRHGEASSGFPLAVTQHLSGFEGKIPWFRSSIRRADATERRLE